MTQVDPEEARRTIESGYVAMSKQDLDEWLKHMTSDVWVTDLPEMPDTRTYRGPEEVRSWAAMNLESVPEWNWAAQEYLYNDGSKLVIRCRLTGRSAAGVPIDMTVFHAMEMKGDKIASVQGFLDETQARDALGLAPGA